MPTASSNRSASVGSSTTSSSSQQSLSSVDGECLYQLACVETLIPLSKDVTLEDEPEISLHPVARIDYSSNFKFVYGLYRALRGHLEYTDAVARQRGADRTRHVIRAVHTSPARWFLLLAFALRQCTSNYTVWKDRRDVIMSPSVLQHCTRDALPALTLPSAVLSTDAADAAARAKAIAEVEESRRKIELVAQHWLPEKADLMGRVAGQPDEDGWAVSSWRAVHWELRTVGCFTRLYHKNFQVWHHRRELLSYALQQTRPPPPPPPSPAHVDPNADTCTAGEELAVMHSEDAFSAYLMQHHGLRFADVDERETVKAVLCNEDGKNYHAWLHLSWYLHALPFLLVPPSWSSLKAFADAAHAATSPWSFQVHPEWAYVSSSPASASTATTPPMPASRRPTLPPSPLTSELDFTAQLIHDDCLNNSAWCHRYALFREDLVRRVWREQPRFEAAGAARGHDEEFQRVLCALCKVEVDFALQWLYVDPTNESAYTHARSVAVLFHTVMVRCTLVRCAIEADTSTREAYRPLQTDTISFLHYLRDAPLCAPVAAANIALCADAGEGTVGSSTPARDELLQRMQQHEQHLSWYAYHDSFSILRHVQRALHNSIRQRVTELQGQAARVLHAAASTEAAAASTATTTKVTLLNSLYERSSQYMLDNFHQIDSAQYLTCQCVLEEMWMLYMTEAQRRQVQEKRPPDAYGEGLKPEWVTHLPWECDEMTEEATDKERDEAVVACFLAYEAAALNLAKRLSVLDPIRFKYWKFEAMNTMQRGYGTAL